MSSDSAAARVKAVPSINVTPLIDVLLVLLIIFMVITPLRPARFKALVPEEPSPRQQHLSPDPLTLVVAINRAGAVSLNGGEPLGTTGEMSKLSVELAATFRRRLEAGTFRRGVIDPSALPEGERVEKTVFVKAPRSISYGEVARVIDAVKGAGANPVGLQIDELEP
ncbi:MAG TPA: biopolymer transporter ExbD [Pyrinomonadaceae bacterium]|nr:biopolymer transporter ExbD [Pyrinomonadaceae bacterium]